MIDADEISREWGRSGGFMPLNQMAVLRASLYGEDEGVWPVNHNVHHDPLSIGVAVLVNLGYSGAISAFGATLLGGLILGGAALGAALLIDAFSPGKESSQQGSFSPQGPAAPQDRQQVVRQSIGPRKRFYGTVKVGGTLAFLESKAGYLYFLITLQVGEISAFRHIWLDDIEVTLDGLGYVQQAPWFRPDSSSVAQILLRAGTSTQLVHAALDTAFTEVTSDFRLRGIANMLAIFREVSRGDLGEVYPHGNPTVTVEMDASEILNVRTGVVEFSDNLADCIYDYLTARDDAGFPYGAGYLPEQVNLASFQAYATVCADNDFRYWGGYALNEELRSVLGRMLPCGDAEIYIDSSGKIAIRGGKWIAPGFTLNGSHIISADFTQGRGALAAFNELTIIYTSQPHDFQEVEAQRWIDTENLALIGTVRPEQLRLAGVPDHTQARHLGKIYTRKRNPLWSGKIVTNFYGFNAIGEETVQVDFPDLGINEAMLIGQVRLLDDMTGVELTVSSLPQSTYDWNPLTEAGTPPTVPDDTTQPIQLDPPDDIDASVATRTLSGANIGAYIIVTWTPNAARPALGYEVQYKRSDESTWVTVGVADGESRAETGLVDDGESYDIQVRTLSPAGTQGAWSDPPLTIAVTADATPPAALTSVVVTGGNARASIAYTAAVDTHQARVSIYRVPFGDVLDTSLHEITNSPFTAGSGVSATQIDGAAVNPTVLVANGSFAVDANWTKGAGWTISGGQAIHAAGSSSTISQAISGIVAGDVMRIGFSVQNYVAGIFLSEITGGATILGAGRSANGTYLETAVATASHTNFAIRGGATANGRIDNAVIFEEPADAAPQGPFDYYVIPRNSSGIAGPTSGPHSVVIY